MRSSRLNFRTLVFLEGHHRFLFWIHWTQNVNYVAYVRIISTVLLDSSSKVIEDIRIE